MGILEGILEVVGPQNYYISITYKMAYYLLPNLFTKKFWFRNVGFIMT